MTETRYYYIDCLKVTAFLEVVLMHTIDAGLHGLEGGGRMIHLKL